MPAPNPQDEAKTSGEPGACWYSRGYLPHVDRSGLVQSLTIRLVDSMPRNVLEAWEQELRHLPDRERDVVRRRRMEAYLDAGHGACWLRDDRIARLAQHALLHFDGERYRLLAWAVMPNHVHFVIETSHRPGGHDASRDSTALSELMYSLKSWTAKQANRLLARRGPFWQREYFDRYIRDDNHLGGVIRYVEENPVNAGLVKRATDWPWSSAGRGTES